MKIDKMIELSIKQIQAGIISANNELKYHYAYIPSHIEFDLSIDVNNNPSEDRIKFTVPIDRDRKKSSCS